MNVRPGELAFIVKVSKNNGVMQPAIDRLVGMVVKCVRVDDDEVWDIEPKRFTGETSSYRYTAELLRISDEYLRPIRGEPEAGEIETVTEIIEQLAPKRQMENTR